MLVLGDGYRQHIRPYCSAMESYISCTRLWSSAHLAGILFNCIFRLLIKTYLSTLLECLTEPTSGSLIRTLSQSTREWHKLSQTFPTERMRASRIRNPALLQSLDLVITGDILGGLATNSNPMAACAASLAMELCVTYHRTMQCIMHSNNSAMTCSSKILHRHWSCCHLRFGI